MSDYDTEAGETVKDRSLDLMTTGPTSASLPFAPKWLEDAAFNPDKRAPLQPDAPGSSLEGLVRPPQDRIDLQRERVQAETGLLRQQSGIIDQDQAEMHRRFAQTGIEPGTLEPWDNNKQREKYRTDPLESFGSIGSVFAMVASAFTHAPMTNALNASAAAMNAIKEGNEKEFELAHRAWKENTDLALKRHNIMQQQYENAIQLMSSDVTAGRAKLQMLAASYDDRQLLALMQSGMDPQWMELLEKRNKVALDTEKVKNNIRTETWANTMFESIQKKNKEEISDPNQRMLADQRAAHTIFGWAAGNKATPAQEEFAVWRMMNPGAAEDVVTKKLHDLGLAGRFATGSAATQDRTQRANEAIQQFEEKIGEPLPPEERNMFHQAFQDKTTGGYLKVAALRAGLEEIANRKADGEKLTAEDRLKILRDHAENGEQLRIKREELRLKQERADRQQKSKEEGHISDDAINSMAHQYVESGDASVKTNLSAGASRGENLARLNEAIERVKKEMGVTPKEMASRIAKFIGEKQYQRTAGGYGARVEVASNEVAQMAPLALESSEKMKRGKFIPLNQVMQMWQRGSSNPDLVEFATNNFGLTTAYVKSMNPTGVPRVQERLEAHVEGLFRTVTSHEAYVRMVQQMAREVQASKKAVQGTRDEKSFEDELLKIINTKPPTRSSSSSAGSPLGGSAKSAVTIPTIKTKAEFDLLDPGTKFIWEKDGKTGEWTK